MHDLTKAILVIGLAALSAGLHLRKQPDPASFWATIAVLVLIFF